MAHRWQFGAENLLADATISDVSGELPANPATNLKNPFTWSKWKTDDDSPHDVTFDLGSAKNIDFVAISDPGWGVIPQGVDVLSSLDGVSYSFLASFTTGEPGQFLMAKFATTSVRYIQFNFPQMGGDPDFAVTLAVVAAGMSVSPVIGEYVGLTPPEYAQDYDVLNAQSENGYLLGRSLFSKGISFKASLEYITPSWWAANGVSFLNAIRLRPTFVAWPALADGSVGVVSYAWTSARVNNPKFSSTQFMDIDLSFQGAR